MFSTLGMTDPIKNDYDGPLLHIMRYYQPAKVYLFMTKRVCELADQDDRYRIHANRLSEREGFACELIELRHAEVDNPQRFDIFHPLFAKELINIYNNNPDCQLLINLSSGTPQMKSACQVLALTTPFPVLPIQVTTPNEAENYGSPNYDLDSNWNNNLDNHPELEPVNRSLAVNSVNLRYLFLREAAISNIEAYNYTAALNILAGVKEFISPEAMHLIRAAQLRKNMDLIQADKEAKLAGYDLFAIKSGDGKELFEYLLLLSLQQQSGQFMDFVRGISPALSRLFELFLQEKCQRYIRRDYCVEKRRASGHWRIMRNKMEKMAPDVLEYCDTKFFNGFRDCDLSSAALFPIIEFDCGLPGKFPNAKVLKKVQAMRNVEESLRNQAAHNIVAIKEEQFKCEAGITSEGLMKEMQWMFKYVFPNYFSGETDPWDSYIKMNNEIIARLKLS